ncbi:hypothetical protein BDV37DRAFT_286453 [Aspergillus pseudonomiae]|uniref:Uncharacterized protein n=1 Tax=Aspergillus pseudonomiae TaxID=1506151 RepID=A0A5N7D2W4_9EURO|nr:uncharacterized protein BDV37DRAFT_286453 [Aspergillus pseudonomiae]KAE8400579.1 hypothetical protein BDV37DRAFT_286453 [Aspergillus pseudonomiae]
MNEIVPIACYKKRPLPLEEIAPPTVLTGERVIYPQKTHNIATAPGMSSHIDKNQEVEEKPEEEQKEEEKPAAEEEETDDDDDREPMYDNTDYDYVRFDPIWYRDQGYAGNQMPIEIEEYLGQDQKYGRYLQMVRSSRTIFHMCGRPDVSSAAKRIRYSEGSLLALERSLAFFLPVISSTNADNEFGPGIYTTGKLCIAKKYAGATGAIMVFSTPDEQCLQCWEPTSSAWRRLTTKWMDLPLADINPPQAYQNADVIKGNMSADIASAQKEKRFVNPEVTKQTAFVSYRGCESLRRELKAIIFVDSSR